MQAIFLSTILIKKFFVHTNCQQVSLEAQREKRGGIQQNGPLLFVSDFKPN